MSEESLNGWCRVRGVFARDLFQWRQSFYTGGSSERRLETAAKLRQLKQAHADLQREMNRKDEALAEAVALLILKKKSVRCRRPRKHELGAETHVGGELDRGCGRGRRTAGAGLCRDRIQRAHVAALAR